MVYSFFTGKDMINQEMFKLGKDSSKIRELFEEARLKKKVLGDSKVFDFTIGNPSIPSPKELDKTLIKLLSNYTGRIHSYTSSIGDEESRLSIKRDLGKRYGAELDENLIYLTVGAAFALTITFNAILLKDEEVITFAPYFTEYKVFVENAGGKLVAVNTDKDFLPDLKELEKAINIKTKAILIDSPNNPTGVFYNEEMIKAIASILEKKEKEFNHSIYLISDEPYRELLYIDEIYPFITNYYTNSIVCYSYSKSLSIPGERIGYIAVNPRCNENQEVFYAIRGAGRSLGFVCAPSLFQHLIKYMDGKTSDINKYKENRDAMMKILDELGYEYVKPQGAFYIFVKALESDANKFVERAKDFNLYFVPSDSFGMTGYIRIAYCVSKESIINSRDAFRKLKESYGG